MRLLGAIVILGLGIAVGWFLRDSREDPAQQRSSRSAELREAPAHVDPPVERPALTEEEAIANLPEESVAAPAPENAEKKEENPQGEKFTAFLKSAMPLIKMQSKRDAKTEAAKLAELLGLDEYREKQLAEALEKDAIAKLEDGLMPLLEGKEHDAEMLAKLNEKDGMTQSLQDDLAGILNNSEMETVCTYYREEEEKARAEAIDAEVEGLAIPDLSKDQEERLREMLHAERTKDDSENATVTSLKEKLKGEGLTKDTMLAALDAKWESRREQYSVFLTPTQLEHLDKQHAEEREEAEAAASMMGGLFGAFMTAKPSGTRIEIKAKAEIKTEEEK